MKRIHGLLLVTLAALLVLPFALPSTASAETVAQKRARAHVIMGQLNALDVKMEKVVERYDAATGQLAGINARIAANQPHPHRHALRPADGQEHAAAARRGDVQAAPRRAARRDHRQQELLVDDRPALHAEQGELERREHGRLDRQLPDDHRRHAEVARRPSVPPLSRLVAQRASEKAGVEGALAARRSLLRGVQSQIAALEAEQAAAARQAAVRSGGYVLTAVPVNPNTSSVVAFAESFVGKVPYVWGGASPAGFDCSGFTMYCWSHFGVSLPHNAAAQQAMCAAVSNPQPGDLVFFGSPAYHVGIYIGGNSMVNAPHTGVMVSYGSVAGASGFGRP